MLKTKICLKCRVEKSFDNFDITNVTKSGIRSQCKSCRAEYFQRNKEKISAYYKIQRKLYPEKFRESQKRYHLKTRDVRLKQMRDYVQSLKQRVYDIYGNKCACCGETNKEFFAVDHIGGGGTDERKKLGSRGVFLAAIKDGFQKEKYQLLCHNCNMSLGFFGYCPHHPEIKRPVLNKNRYPKV